MSQPYGDEIFVDRESIFYQPGRDKAQPDEEKNALLAAINYYGGKEWNEYYQAIAPALAAAKRLATPVSRVLTTADEAITFQHRLLARQGDGGAGGILDC